jgi:iron complex transport system substrate-binding protein
MGVTEAAVPLLEKFDTQWREALAHVAKRQAGEPKPLRVLFILGHSGMQSMVAGAQTAADAMIRYAGARNAVESVNGYKVLTPEAAATAAPDVILTTDDALQAAGGPAQFAANPALALTPAGRAGRVVAMNDLLLLGFGPRLPQAVAQLSDRLRDG